MYDLNYLIPGELLICKMKSFCPIKTTNFIPQDCSEWIVPENKYKDHALPRPQRQVPALLGRRGIPLAVWHKRLPSLSQNINPSHPGEPKSWPECAWKVSATKHTQLQPQGAEQDVRLKKRAEASRHVVWVMGQRPLQHPPTHGPGDPGERSISAPGIWGQPSSPRLARATLPAPGDVKGSARPVLVAPAVTH